GEGLEEAAFLPSPSGEGPGVRSRGQSDYDFVPAKGDERVWQEDLEVVTPYYGVDDVPPPLETLLYAWQHTLVDVSPYVLPLMVAGAVGYTAAQAAAMISACLTVMGLATFANATWG